ncbi:beta-3-deoxy-D-manno-oct-2-ulosonic acid transferase [Variovorax sp. PCZ-1]|uniref:capsular polysaccharide export protein, LipB/KpsS family n=1 Tax=Variovorax sp. PCZ-1 TaxID=2835533 RepID=UPI001BCC552F|nr:beta-3-deoxy-D-manno-oct-2-ulosonic acid transferase [Variovorax sp. PCZ-1]MBS7807664.1 beta-3-deoxy-D-manno-oct-2-ulosonic acid transferase [Variovorax sp. PCZ-1]
MLMRWLRPWGEQGRKDAAVRFVWGNQGHAVSKLAQVHVEDGMIRSVGLGADLVTPLSWVFDTKGMYFDATRPSDLEHMLKNCQLGPERLQRAADLRERLVAQKITKYNLAGEVWQRPGKAKHVILVAGQVETDASIRLGAAHVRSNSDLLQAARQMRPDSYIVYKPHPDVQAGLRAGALSAQLHGLYDELVTQADINSLYAHIDELHVISSLAGFEALLRGIKVVCHGMPFYAGWGLCEAPNMSQEVLARRGRAATLDELVACVLLSYASYRSPYDGSEWTAEQALDELAAQSAHSSRQITVFTKLRRRVLAAWARWRGYF